MVVNLGSRYGLCGLQRLTACIRFLNNEIQAFGTLYKNFDKLPTEVSLIFNMGNFDSVGAIEW